MVVVTLEGFLVFFFFSLLVFVDAHVKAKGYVLSMASRFLAGAAHANRSGGQLMSQFIVVGASVEVAEDSLVVDPSLLFVYPPDKPLLDVSLPLFCFPDGVRLKKLRRTTSSSRINEVRYSNLSLLESVRSSFTFLLTGHEEVL
jgi:hypothetical protein